MLRPSGLSTATGQLLTKGALDYESEKTSYSVIVTATDPSSLSDTIEVTITVTDVNEAPAVTVTPTVYFNENGTGKVATYTAADPENAALTWEVTGVDSNAFSIDGGVLTFKTPPDFEAPTDADTDNVYMVTVEASDSANTDMLAVAVRVTDVNEAPMVTGNIGVGYAENGSTTVATYTANDPEKGTTTWSLSGVDNGHFSINGGVLTFKTPPDFEAPADADRNNVYLATVGASDGPNTGTLEVTITVTGVNEAPAFAAETATRTVPENTEPGQPVGAAVSATDPETGDTLTYTLGGTDADAFDIDGSTGQLKTKDPLDHETTPSYSVAVSVRDGNHDAAMDDTINVTITITDVNESPTVTGETSRNYEENGSGTVATYTAADPENGEITWSLSGADSGDFSIDNAGALTFDAPPDYEAPADVGGNNEYEITLWASDGPNIGTLDVTVTVTNADEAGTVTLSSLQPQVGTTLTASVDDPDGGVSGDTWKWEGSSNKSDWAPISGATAISYTPVAGDVGKFLQVTASYTDGHGPGKTAIVVSDNKVRVAPAANTAPAFAGDATTRTVEENTEAGRNIGDPVSATDAESDPLTYSLSGTDAASFDVVQASGQLLTKAPLDYESAKRSYTVIVTATDPSGESDTIDGDHRMSPTRTKRQW